MPFELTLQELLVIILLTSAALIDKLADVANLSWKANGGSGPIAHPPRDARANGWSDLSTGCPGMVHATGWSSMGERPWAASHPRADRPEVRNGRSPPRALVPQRVYSGFLNIWSGATLENSADKFGFRDPTFDSASSENPPRAREANSFRGGGTAST